MEQVFIGLGSNLDHDGASPLEILRLAGARLGECLREMRTSSVWTSAPRDYPDQADFRNAVLRGMTPLEPHALLDLLLTIEKEFHRTRDPGRTKGPRTLDLDLLLYADRIIVDTQLVVPHPSMRERKFVLVPLAELDPSLRDPVSGRPFIDFLSRLSPQRIRLDHSMRDALFYA